MTQIVFYSGAADKLETACRLCVKAMQQGLNVMVYSLDNGMLERMDRLLWTFSPTSFVPHCRDDEDNQLIGVTPIILGNKIAQGMASYDLLLNLHDQCPPSFDQFQKLIEIAGTSHNDKLSARSRYRFYQEGGYEINHYNLADQTDC